MIARDDKVWDYVGVGNGSCTDSQSDIGCSENDTSDIVEERFVQMDWFNFFECWKALPAAEKTTKGKTGLRGNVLQKEDKEVSSGSGEIDRVVVIELRKELGVVPEQEEWSGESDDVQGI